MASSAMRASAPGQAATADEAITRYTIGEEQVLVADPGMARAFELIERLARSDLPVLITGETGSGKEVAASALHHWSPRRAEKMLALNCAALQDTLVESELFGFEK